MDGSMSRVFNFSAGPAILPETVLRQAQNELLDWRGTGMSVMEMSHRDKAFMSIATEAEATLREILRVPPNYKVLFVQGGATAQFSFVPMNLAHGKPSADYLVTGFWGRKAAKEAQRYGRVNIVAQPEVFTAIPARDSWSLDPQAAYLHYTPNETIDGVEMHEVPDAGSVPLVADYSSSFLAHPIDVSKFGLIYAGAQKNAGPAGITIILVREDLLGHSHPLLPPVFDYKTIADNGSMLNTPPTYSWYICGLVFKWIRDQGGLTEIGARNQRKAQRLYDYLDGQDFYQAPVERSARSRMNVVFRLADSALDADFVAGAAKAGLPGIKGHRIVGGMRASLYNAMTEAGVEALVDYMKEFVRVRG